MRYLLIITLLLLSSCGFHLRGSVALPPELSEITVRDTVPATNIAPELRGALRDKGVRVTKSAALILQLHAEQVSRRVLSVDSSGRAQEYGLGYVVRFSLRGENGMLWLPEQSISTTRDLRFDATAVLGTSGEESQLHDEMRRDAVLRILRRLQHAKRPAEKVLPAKALPEKANKE